MYHPQHLMDRLTEAAVIPQSPPLVGEPPLALVWQVTPAELHDWAVELASREKDFRPAEVSHYARGRHVPTLNRAYRDSLQLPSSYFPKPAEEILAILRNGRDHFEEALLGRSYTWSDVSMKYLAYGDGGLFELHRDTLRMHREERLMTFVYFMHREPRGFTGGELELVGENGQHVVVEPRGGSLAIFNSRTLHRVRPVTCKSESFLDRRLVLCGFICRRRTLATQARVWLGVVTRGALRRLLRYPSQRSRGRLYHVSTGSADRDGENPRVENSNGDSPSNR